MRLTADNAHPKGKGRGECNRQGGAHTIRWFPDTPGNNANSTLPRPSQGSAVVELSGLPGVSATGPSRSDLAFEPIPSFFILVIKVVRLSPRRLAAPFGPPTRPSACFRA